MKELWAFWSQNQVELLALTGQHLAMVAISVSLAVAVGVPAGIASTRYPSWERPVLGFVNVVQTVPSLALFGFLIPLPWLGGIGTSTAVVALVLYALLPIVRNTHAGIRAVEPSLRESGLAMGMTDRQLLFLVELPLAAGVILAGVRVAAITSVGIATIAAAIGAGGLGMYIFRGVAGVNTTLILAGAVPAALLALMTDWGLGRLERRWSFQPASRPAEVTTA